MKRTFICCSIVIAILAVALLLNALNGPRRSRRSIFHQSEAKIAMAAIYGAEKTYFGTNARYSTSLEALGFTAEEFKRLLSLAISQCENSARVPPLVFDFPKAEKIGASLSTIKMPLRRWMEEEDCKNRKHGFAAFSVIESDEKPDVAEIWRIDERKVLDMIEVRIR